MYYLKHHILVMEAVLGLDLSVILEIHWISFTTIKIEKRCSL